MSKNLLNNSQIKINLNDVLGNTENTMQYKKMNGVPEVITLVTSKGYRSFKTPMYAETKDGRVYNFGDVRNYRNAKNQLVQAPAFLVRLAEGGFEMLSKENWEKYKPIFEEKAERINKQREKILRKIESVKKTDTGRALDMEEEMLCREFNVDNVYNNLPDVSITQTEARESLGIM